MDSLPPINKVFSLISQGEHQKKIGSHINVGSYFLLRLLILRLLEVIKDKRRIDLSALIVAFMVLPLINVTKYMAIYLVTNVGKGIILLIPTITLLLIKYQTNHSLILLSRLIN